MEKMGYPYSNKKRKDHFCDRSRTDNLPYKILGQHERRRQLFHFANESYCPGNRRSHQAETVGRCSEEMKDYVDNFEKILIEIYSEKRK